MGVIKKIFDMKILSDGVYYKVAFLLFALISTLSFGPQNLTYVSPIMLGWGLIVIINNLLVNKIKFPRKYLILMYGFLISYIITIAINYKYNLVGNAKTLLWTSIEFFALCIVDIKKSKEETNRDLIRISRATILGVFVTSFISLVQFAMNITYWTTRADGHKIPQGFFSARLWGIYVDPNQACNLAIIAMGLSFILLAKRKGLFRPILIINIIVQYLFIILSGSRGGEIGIAVLFVGTFYVLLEKLLKNKISGSIIRGIISFVLTICISGGLILSFDKTREAATIVPEKIYELTNNVNTNKSVDKQKTVKTEKPKKIDLTVQRADASGSNGRLELWTQALKISKHYPIFGTGDRNIMIYAGKLMPNSYISRQYIHNGYIHMLVAGGGVAALIMLLLLARIGLTSLKRIFIKRKEDEEYLTFGFLVSMVGSMLLTTLFITEVFFQNSFTAAAVWILIGYIVYYLKNEKFTA